MIDFKYSLAAVIIIAVVVYFTRLVTFLFFPTPEKTPKFVFYLGDVLPPAVMGMLIVYCLKGISFKNFPFGLPEFIAVAAVALVHLKFKNNLISIFGGTILYMVLVQVVFA